MTINANPLGWNDTKLTRDINKDYINRPYNLIVPNGEILPFQITKPIVSQVVDETVYTFTYEVEKLTSFSYFGQFNFNNMSGNLRLECEIKLAVDNGMSSDNITGELALNNGALAGTGLVPFVLTDSYQTLSLSYVASDQSNFNNYRFYLSKVGGLNIPAGTAIQIRYVEFYDEEDNRVFPIGASPYASDTTLSIVEGQGLGPYTINIIDFKTQQSVYSGSIDVDWKTYISDNNELFYIFRHFGGDIGYDLLNGVYEAYLEDSNGGIWYSELFSIYSEVSNFVKFQFSASQDLFFIDKLLYFDNSFTYELYVDTEIARPNYEYTEEAEEKNGYRFYSLQVLKKKKFFTAVLPEFLVDVMSIIRLCDLVRIKDKNNTFESFEFLITPEWDEFGDVANCDCEFVPGSIIKKTNAFKNIDNLGEYDNSDYNTDYKNQIG